MIVGIIIVVQNCQPVRHLVSYKQRAVLVIDSIDLQLRGWVQALLPDTSVEFAPPAQRDVSDALIVHLYLLQILPSLTRLQAASAISVLRLRYLIAISGGEPTVSHRLLGELAFAALESDEFEVDLEPLGADIWSALGVLPQPSLVLQVPLRRERPHPEAPLVRVPLVLDTATITSLTGVVLSPEDTPISGAHVELPDLHLRQRTDSRGKFHFPTVPRAERQTVLVRAKGREVSVAVAPSSHDEPVIIRFNPREEEG
jgi:hypothetical protein